VQLIESLIDRGNPREALMLISTARERGDTDLDLDLHQAAALMQTGMTQESERLLLTYLGRRPRDERAWRKLGILQADDSRAAEAVESFQRASDLDDSHADTWNNLGFMLLSEARYEEAVVALRRANALDGTKPRYRNNLGFALAGVGDISDALQVFMSAALPADAHANMGLALERGGNTDGALEQYTLALEFDDGHTASREAVARLSTPLETAP
jgi:Flp pilus assembly protein TadD